VYRFDMGGLENGVVNIINGMPFNSYRHIIISLTEITEFKNRILRDDVKFIALQKPNGHAFFLYPRIFKLFRELRPDIVHTRNLAALETLVPAWLAGCSVRIHGEHGRDVGDLDGRSKKYQLVRRIYAPFVNHYLALSRDLAHYLNKDIHVPSCKITQVYNGVDAVRFSPLDSYSRRSLQACPFTEDRYWIVGTVGRMQTVKDQLSLVRGFIRSLDMAPQLKLHVRLVLVGDGPLRQQCKDLLDLADMADLAWLPGERNDVADIMRGLDCFVLPSLAEGISNTILEAMACGLPVIATDVGGNADLVVHGVTGHIVAVNDAEAIAKSLVFLAESPKLAKKMGQAGRLRVLDKFSLDAMVATYQGLYDHLLGTGESTVQVVPTNK
jgi:sugar transferase (PEP-CTERM/EpsH1 system associated)